MIKKFFLFFQEVPRQVIPQVHGLQSTRDNELGNELLHGQTFRTIKYKFYEHQSDLRHHIKLDSTTLSTYVWRIREAGEEPVIR